MPSPKGELNHMGEVADTLRNPQGLTSLDHMQLKYLTKQTSPWIIGPTIATYSTNISNSAK